MQETEQWVIEMVTGYAKTHGVGISIEADDEAFHVSDIGREDRNDPSSKGFGLKTLQLLCAHAAAMGWNVEIEHMNDEPKLGELYGSLNFRVYEVGHDITSMRWKPEYGV